MSVDFKLLIYYGVLSLVLVGLSARWGKPVHVVTGIIILWVVLLHLNDYTGYLKPPKH